MNNSLLRCRIEGQLKVSLGQFVNDSHLQCAVEFQSKSQGPVDAATGERLRLFVSNDGGRRWASGLSIDRAIRFAGGTHAAAISTNTVYPAEVVIGVLVPDQTKNVELVRAIRAGIAASRRYFKYSSLRAEFINTHINATVALDGLRTMASNPNNTNLVGLVGAFYSSVSIPVARAFSTVQQLPMVSCKPSHAAPITLARRHAYMICPTCARKCLVPNAFTHSLRSLAHPNRRVLVFNA